MEFGAHLPLLAFDDRPYSLERLLAYADGAARLSYGTVCANDHLVFSRPWLDGPTALAAVLDRTADMSMATTVSLPIVRGPVPLAKTLAAIDLLSGGRLIVGVGPGSSERDYVAAGVPFEERWKRLDEVVPALRSLWRRESNSYKGDFYDTDQIELRPFPARSEGPPIWIGCWGSTAGLRRTARLGDGWLASAYNTTPKIFGAAWLALKERLVHEGKDADGFPNALATMFMLITEDRVTAERTIQDILGPTIRRPVEELAERLLVGPAEECAEKLAAYEAAGLQRVYLWPVADDLRQLETFQERVAPMVAAAA